MWDLLNVCQSHAYLHISDAPESSLLLSPCYSLLTRSWGPCRDLENVWVQFGLHAVVCDHQCTSSSSLARLAIPALPALVCESSDAKTSLLIVEEMKCPSVIVAVFPLVPCISFLALFLGITFRICSHLDGLSSTIIMVTCWHQFPHGTLPSFPFFL